MWVDFDRGSWALRSLSTPIYRNPYRPATCVCPQGQRFILSSSITESQDLFGARPACPLPCPSMPPRKAQSSRELHRGGPQENESCREPKSASTRVKNTPPPNHAARFGRGGARRRVHQAVMIGIIPKIVWGQFTSRRSAPTRHRHSKLLKIATAPKKPTTTKLACIMSPRR